GAMNDLIHEAESAVWLEPGLSRSSAPGPANAGTPTPKAGAPTTGSRARAAAWSVGSGVDERQVVEERLVVQVGDPVMGRVIQDPVRSRGAGQAVRVGVVEPGRLVQLYRSVQPAPVPQVADAVRAALVRAGPLPHHGTQRSRVVVEVRPPADQDVVLGVAHE